MKPALVILFVLLCSALIAQVPGTLSYQGILMQNDGITPITDGSHSIVFSFYTASSGGSALFSRTISVTTTKGLYTCIIGDGTSGNAALPSTLGSQQIYIGIAVDGGSELSPRAQLTTTAYAYQAQSAYDISNNAVTSAKILDGTIVDADIHATAAIADTKLATISTAGKVSGGAITSGTIGGSTIINTSGAITAGAITGTSFAGNGSALTNITSASITDGTIVNADINATAAIADTKLATISTAGKVSGNAITSGTIAGSTSINTTGTITIPAANEYSYAAAKTHYYSLSPADFVLYNISIGAMNAASNVYSISQSTSSGIYSANMPGTVTYLIAPVHLPDGATVTELSATGYYGGTDGPIFRLMRKPRAQFTLSIMVQAQGTDSSGQGTWDIAVSTTVTNPIIDNANYNYQLVVVPDSGGGGSIGDARITYTVTKAD